MKFSGFDEKAAETKNQNGNNPKKELLERGMAELEVLKKVYETAKAEKVKLLEELEDMKDKRSEKRFFDRNRSSYVEYREKFFPKMMQDNERMKQIIDEMNKNSGGKISKFHDYL